MPEAVIVDAIRTPIGRALKGSLREGEQYIAAGVEAVSRAGLGAGMIEEVKNPLLERLT